jgi:hypothetical protein
MLSGSNGTLLRLQARPREIAIRSRAQPVVDEGIQGFTLVTDSQTNNQVSGAHG